MILGLRHASNIDYPPETENNLLNIFLICLCVFLFLNEKPQLTHLNHECVSVNSTQNISISIHFKCDN